jgi:hypothetical protein
MCHSMSQEDPNLLVTWKKTINIAVSGAAGQISNHLLFMVRPLFSAPAKSNPTCGGDLFFCAPANSMFHFLRLDMSFAAVVSHLILAEVDMLGGVNNVQAYVILGSQMTSMFE